MVIIVIKGMVIRRLYVLGLALPAAGRAPEEMQMPVESRENTSQRKPGSSRIAYLVRQNRRKL